MNHLFGRHLARHNDDILQCEQVRYYDNTRNWYTMCVFFFLCQVNEMIVICPNEENESDFTTYKWYLGLIISGKLSAIWYDEGIIVYVL